MTALRFDRINSCPEAGLPEMIGAGTEPANGTFVLSHSTKEIPLSPIKQAS